MTSLGRRRLAFAGLALACLSSNAFASGPAGRAAQWVASKQLPDGSFFTSGTPADAVADAISALVAGGGPARSIRRALEYVRANGEARASSRAAYAGRIAMALVASGEDPRAFGGVDYVEKIKSFYQPTGMYDTGSAQFSNGLAALGLLAAGERLPAGALRAIRLARCPDGGFSYDPGCGNAKGSDVDTTSVVLCVLVAAGVPSSDGVRADARAFLLAAVNQEGGYGFYADEPTNANSTGLALAAIAAMGERVDTSPWSTPGGNPRKALYALQTSDGGFRYSASRSKPDGFATVQAIPGAAGIALPVHRKTPVLPTRRTSVSSTSPSAPAYGATQKSAVPTNAPATKTKDAIQRQQGSTTAATVSAAARENVPSRTVPLLGAIAALAFSSLRLRAVVKRKT